jgi:hypothetical protein
MGCVSSLLLLLLLSSSPFSGIRVPFKAGEQMNYEEEEEECKRTPTEEAQG